MTVHALGLASGVTTAQLHRLGLSALATGNGGLNRISGIYPSYPSWEWATVTNMSISVGPGAAWVDGTATAAQGGYAVTNDSTVTVTFDPGNTSTIRTDQVIIHVYDDAFDGSGYTKVEIEVLKGNTSTGAKSTLPYNSLCLYEVAVPAGASGGSGGIDFISQLLPVYTWSVPAGGITLVRDIDERTAMGTVLTGTTIYRQDIGAHESMSSSWETLSLPTTSSVALMANYSPKVMTVVGNTSDQMLYRYNGSSWVPNISAPMCVVYNNAIITLTSGSETAATFNSEVTDPYSWHSTVTNTGRITPTFAGWYRVSGSCGFSGGSTGGRRKVTLLKNGSAFLGCAATGWAITTGSMAVAGPAPLVYMNGTTDYLSMSLYTDSTSDHGTGSSNEFAPYMSAVLERASTS